MARSSPAPRVPKRTAPPFSLPVLIELARFHTPEHLLIFYPAAWGFCFAASLHPLPLHILIPKLLAVYLSMALGHGAFCSWNDILDASLDAQVPRCATRPIPSGRCEPWHAFIWYLTLLATSIGLMLGSCEVDLKHALPPVLLAAVYPLMKRVSSYPQLLLAFLIALGVPMGWIAAAGEVAEQDRAMVWVLELGVAAWVVGFDCCYALQDAKADEKTAVKSLVLKVGSRWMKAVIAALMVAAVGCISVATTWCRLGWAVTAVTAVIGLWGASLVVMMKTLDLEKPETGRRIFRWNITTGGLLIVAHMFELVLSGL